MAIGKADLPNGSASSPPDWMLHNVNHLGEGCPEIDHSSLALCAPVAASEERSSGECCSGRLGGEDKLASQALHSFGRGSMLTGVIVVVQTFMPGSRNLLSFSRSSVSTTM